MNMRFKVFMILSFCLVVNCFAEEQKIKITLKELLPLPKDAPRDIQNPYWAKPAWKLWAKDPTPVKVGENTISPPEEKDRKYPSFSNKPDSPLEFLSIKDTVYAGMWDDSYMSLDNYHTKLRYPKGLFMIAGKEKHSYNNKLRMELGVNFTSQSYSERGRHIVDDLINNLNTEKNFFFANCVRATPSHVSYEDKDENQVKEIYDALHAHSFHSVGQSGSEIHALYKMMLAGGAMPRKIKNLLKQHGAYAPTVLTLFKAALPYSDADGKELPYEHELRHRPVYSSKGVPQHGHYCPANFHYHGYNEYRHLRTMIEMAKGMTMAPPVALMQLVALEVTKDGKPLGKTETIKHIKSSCLTSTRIWGNAGETIKATIDLNNSYDLQNQDLSFTCKKLYPNQNVTVEKVAPGRFAVTVKHDPKLPKGRIPVICVARNQGSIPSNPVFLNFYFAGENEMPDRLHLDKPPKELKEKIKKMGWKKLPVTINKRPKVETHLDGDTIVCHPGQTVTVDLSSVKDPEGYPLHIYRWSGEIGTLKGTTFTALIPDDAKPNTEQVHFIFSDGTGGYSGCVVKLAITDTYSKLANGFDISVLGSNKGFGDVSAIGQTFTFRDRPLPPKQTRDLQGLFAFKRFTDKQADIQARIEKTVKKSIYWIAVDKYAGCYLTSHCNWLCRK